MMGNLDDLIADEKETPAAKPIHPLVDAQVLAKPSPEPFAGQADPKYSELDSLEPLYIPKYLYREWGEKRFFDSAYWRSWKREAARGGGPDLKPSEQKKKGQK